MSEIGNKRDNCIDIVKGIAIILMVLGHSGISEDINRFIYLFHMAVFFVASGYCYNEKYSQSIKDFGRFGKRKITTLYIPYFIWTVTLILLHNFLLDINIYTDSPEFLEGDLGNGNGILQKYSIKQILYKIIKTIMAVEGEQLFGASWFIRVLFWMSVFWCLIDTILKKICKQKISILRIIFAGICLILGWMMTKYNILNIVYIPVIFSSCCIFILGVYLRKISGKYEMSKKVMGVVGGSSLLVLGMIYFFGGSVDMIYYESAISFVFSALAGWGFLYAVAWFLDNSGIKTVRALLSYLGKNTMCIVMFHFAAFKLVTFVQVLWYDLPDYRMASFPVYRGDGMWWLVYTICGITVPLILNFIYKKVIIIGKRAKEYGEKI